MRKHVDNISDELYTQFEFLLRIFNRLTNETHIGLPLVFVNEWKSMHVISQLNIR